jgi:hypothetical protein
MPDPSQFNTDRTYPGRWTISSTTALSAIGPKRTSRSPQ